MTQISGRSGGMSKLPGVGQDDPNDPATLAETIAQSSLTDGAGGATDATAAGGDNPLAGATTSQGARDAKATEATFKAADERHDAASERAAKRTVGGRNQGIPQALDEKGDDEGSLSPAAIAAHIGRVRI